jgi:hypothetical protein
MADTKYFAQLAPIGTVDGAKLLAVQTEPAGSAGFKMTLNEFADWAITIKTYSGLTTTSKVVEGAINELKAGKANVTTVDAVTYTFLATDYILSVIHTATASVTITIPSALISILGRLFIIKDAGLNATTNNITIATEGSETIDGQANFVLIASGESVCMYSDGSNLFIY